MLLQQPATHSRSGAQRVQLNSCTRGPHFAAQLSRFEIRASNLWSLVCAFSPFEGFKFLVAIHWATLTSPLRFSFSRIIPAAFFCRFSAFAPIIRFLTGHFVRCRSGALPDQASPIGSRSFSVASPVGLGQ